MRVVKFYVRGHGGGISDALPPAEDLPIYLVTIGQMGSTMSDEVADKIIFEHWNTTKIQQGIDSELLIYWTRQQRDDYYANKGLAFSKPSLSIQSYEWLSTNLILQGDQEIGECGLCYWDETTGKLVWVFRLEDEEEKTLSEIFMILQEMAKGEKDLSIELYWSACMSAEYWQGTDRKVSFNPDKK